MRNAKWDLELPIQEARRNDELIALADSQMLRWIDQLNCIEDADASAKQIKAEIRSLRKLQPSTQTKREIRKLYADLDAVQFKPDYMCLIIDKIKDYYRACSGFKINGVKYKRLLGTNGGIKNSTIVFVSERLYPELARRVENGRDPDKEIVTAKLEAYKALTCSASIPVSMPRGILVVDDAETLFREDIMYLSDESDGEPCMELKHDYEINLDATDGFGLMLPSLAQRWSDELELDYMIAGANSRFSFEKGMIFTFDFLDFAQNVAGNYIVRDAWGDEVDVRNVELIMTTSMVKLYDSYKSCDDYIKSSLANGYTFGITKTCPRELEDERSLNYQFIQSYDLSDDDIDRLIEPTVSEFRDVLSGDWRKSVLFLKGKGLCEKNVGKLDNDYIKAIMIDRRVMNDPFVQDSIFQLIRNRIDEAKVGVIKVHGNYSIVSGDPYLLCQSIFGLEKTGLLRAGEIYNKYWADTDAEKLVCFRAPMTCHENIRCVTPVRRDDATYWFKYMNTCTILNAWDTTAAALNGCDFDGDLVMLTDNEILVSRHKQQPTLFCAQKRAEKKISSEEDFIKSNIDSFGNEIGETTNWITSMFEVRAGFEPESKEYKTLTYRIQCGELYQQNAIDKAKGIICKPMPRYWHDRKSIGRMNITDEEKYFQRSISADKKPYFMKYIYPSLKKQYTNYIKNTNRNALRQFQESVDEMLRKPYQDLTDAQIEFLRHYEYGMPVGINDCVMNKICRKFEMLFDGDTSCFKKTAPFDYGILKSGVSYPHKTAAAIEKIYGSYNRKLINFATFLSYERLDKTEASETLEMLNDEFRRDCDRICPDREVLCDILVDICYSKKSSKRFVWNMCGDQIIKNLLGRNNDTIFWPESDPDGTLRYCGRSFSIKSKTITEEE